MVLGDEHSHLCHARTIARAKHRTRSHSGTCERVAWPDVPEWDLVARSGRTNSRCLMQTSPFPPIPPALRSGRTLPAPRSDSEAPVVRVLIGDSDGEFR